ncbi:MULTISPECIES: HAD-IG family 5'-nucleotidase [Legionella]|uniref:5'-nucleotidase n=1 Tax=Legionella septentrionalis TaxID=2498109 RepID=A0A3S0VN15_9GAMM|nr:MULTISPECIES: HAD-IG family 5'-nucleotidase [Legionella]MCP0913719.1 HAD-IG family 5'-nucleotidase [Legionella sp. 27cVA30]RUQ85416.1 5'-nucleotidase [Legionella septentrionalis]RUQ99330.1 5'-nucleotidase [Legionella septentrionalis]RUR14807.1 5'-nucleotidase [Legionella septentrionalis]
MNQKVFVNRILNMKKIKFIGLDMDHTLIRYKTENFEALVYQLVIDNLINSKKYPENIRSFKFNFKDAIRGLVVDSKNGNILKLSRYAAIRQSYHGTQAIQFSDQKQFYRSIYVDLGDPNYMAIDTSFSIAFCVLYSQLIDYKDQYPHELPSYNVIALDVLNSVDEVHAEGTLKRRICDAPEQFVYQDHTVVEGLKRYIKHGKKIFILTNSEYQYAKLLLEYTIDPFMEKGKNWQDLFEYVITLANKPRFFYDESRFLAVHPTTGTMTNVTGKITPGVYQGGYATKFTEDLHLKGDEILYIGDHIYGDILRLKKDCNWRTALVVEELGDEIAAQVKARPVELQINAAMKTKRKLEENYIKINTKSIEEETHVYDNEIQALQIQINAVDKQIMELLQEQHKFFNPKWERIFRAGAEESYFAYQVDRYACIYMERLSDLLEHSPLTYFRANRRLLAHDLDNILA